MSRILVVEDEQHLAEGLRFNLEAEGYQVEVVETGEAALERLMPESARFDVVVLDVMLPGKDGFTVMRELRQAGQFIPTLMLTARGHAEDILQGFEAGADDYLTKPFELAILIARIGGLLRRREWLAAAMPLTPAPTEEARAAQRARQLAEWVKTAIGSPRQTRVFTLNAGQYRGPRELGSSYQRRAVILVAGPHEEDVNMSEGLRSGLEQQQQASPLIYMLLHQYSRSLEWLSPTRISKY